MNKIKQYAIALGAVATMALPFASKAADLDATDVGSMYSATVSSVTSILSTNIPLVLVIVAAIVGLTFLIRFLRRHTK